MNSGYHQGVSPVTALVPYYGYRKMESNWALSNPMNRPGYLERTVASLRRLGGEIIIGTLVDDPTLPVIDGTRRIRFDCSPYLLPAHLLRWAQGWLDQFPGDIYYTEADQVLHYDPAVLSVVKGSDYLVPHRLEQVGQHGEGVRDLAVDWNGVRWAVSNGRPEGEGYYHPHSDDFETNHFIQYGAAYLCSKELLAKAVFTDSLQDRPLEHSSGFDISAAGHALKTSDWQQFFVEHLSGYETNEREAGRWDGLTPRG